MSDGRLRGARNGVSPVAHLHAQGRPHDEAYVVADEPGLRALGRAVTQALGAPDGIGKARVFTADGEGYDVVVVLSDPDELASAELPYVETDALDPRPQAIHPAAIYWGLKRTRTDEAPPARG